MGERKKKESKLLNALDMVFVPGSMGRAAKEVEKSGEFSEGEINSMYENVVNFEVGRLMVYAFGIGYGIYKIFS